MMLFSQRRSRSASEADPAGICSAAHTAPLRDRIEFVTIGLYK